LSAYFRAPLRKLDDERRFALHIAAEQAEALFHVVNVVCANGEFSVSDLEELSGSNDHKFTINNLMIQRFKLERFRGKM
jgi:hypothetical protein